jgi:hypothetical protein
MTQTNRRAFLRTATAVAVGATAGLPEAAAQTPEPATEYEAFVRLSSILTGLSEKELPSSIDQQDEEGTRLKLYEIYFQRVRMSFPTEFRELLATWRSVQNAPNPEQALSEKLAAAGAAGQRLRVAARQVIKIWYLSATDDPRTPLDPKGKNNGQLGGDLGQYQLSAIWGLIGAPVPGYSNSPHGYWVDKPSI